MRSWQRIIDLRRAFFYLFFPAVIVGSGILVLTQFERHVPTVKVRLSSDYIGTRPFEVEINERGKGLRTVSISLLTAGTEYPIVVKEYDSAIMAENITVTLSADKPGISEGPAVLRVIATDRSYWRFSRGNKTIVNKNVTVDVTPPTIELVSGDRYVNLGGSGLIIYRSSRDSTKSGIKIGEYWFPGYKGYLEDPDTYMAFFAHPYDVPADKKAVIIAEDAAGNSRHTDLSYTLRNVKYKKSTVNVTDGYIERKVLPLLSGGSSQQSSLKDAFIKVNRGLRRENEAKIRKICEKSTNSVLWRGAFHQLSKSKVEANFADERAYVYKGEVIDHAYHLGYDLAVTTHYPIEAANHGVVVFTGDLGIYGKTVIVDHGLGVFTMYSHMSSMDVKKDDEVKQKQIIGKTGETGLAIGDHLHYTTLIHGVPILPLEWWDGKWVEDNILNKIRHSTTGLL